MCKITEILMDRDGLSELEAKSMVEDAREAFYNGEDPEEVLYDLGLEPDYIFDLI